MQIHEYSAAELASLIRRRELSPVEITEHYLRRIDALNPKLNAFITVDYEGAIAAAREAESSPPQGPLHGVPVAVKDLSLTKGLRSTSGSLTLKDNIPSVDSVSAERIREAGGIIIGKTNTPEFGYKGVTDNRLGEPTLNPWDTSRTSGGSSGGSAAAVAAGLAPVAEGTDGAGSIRIPAGFCGVVGIKPSFARVPRYPIPDIYYTLSHTGPIARTADDAALLLDVLSGYDKRDPLSMTEPLRLSPYAPEPLRIAWSPRLNYAPLEPEIEAITEKAALKLCEAGHSVERADPDITDPEPLELNIWNTVYAARYGPLEEPMRSLFTPELAEIVDEGMRLPAWRLCKDSIERTKLYYEMEKFFGTFDLLLTPTLPVEAFPVEKQRPETVEGRPITTLFGWTPFTYPFNLTGQPAVTVPAGLTASGLPAGLQIIGPRGSEALIMQVARQFEYLAPWQKLAPIANI